MAFDWREYLQLAGFLHATAGAYTEEAAWRSAVSRAYYGAFGYARNAARARDGFVPSGGPEDHDRLRDHFRAQREDQVAQQLGRLRHWRNQCDYDEEVERLGLVVANAIATAQQVVNRL